MKNAVVAASTLVALCLFTSTAFAQVTASQELLLGTWDVDVAAMMAAEGAGPDELAMAEAMSMQITLTADGTMAMSMSMMGETETEQGTWVFVGTEGPYATITATSPDGETSEVVFTFIDYDNATSTADGETLILTRAAAEADEGP